MFKRIALIGSLVALTACSSVPHNSHSPVRTAEQKKTDRAIQRASKITDLAFNRLAKKKPTNHRTYTDVAYGSHSRQKLDIYLPKNATGNVPTVIYIHGGAWLFGNKSQATAPLVQDQMMKRFLDAGYAVVAMNYRFAPEHFLPVQTDDAIQAFHFIYNNAEKYGLDKQRLAVLGDSAGGHLASYLSTTQGKKVRANVAFYAPTDVTNLTALNKADPHCPNFTWADTFKNGAKKDWDLTAYVLNEPYGSPEFVKKAQAVSPINLVNANTSPTLLLHGTKDCYVSYQSSVNYLKKLQQHQIPSELVTLVDEGHSTLKFWVTPEYQEKVLAFLKKYL